MENNEVFETLEETTNETEEVVNEEEEEEEEVTDESGNGLALAILGAGLAGAAVVYGTVKGVKWLCRKAVKKARKHKKVKENQEQLTQTLEADAKEEPMDVKVPEIKPINAD